MSDSQNYITLEPADHTLMVAALNTIYEEGMGSFPPNPNWDDDWWNSYSLEYIPDVRPFLMINALQGESDMPDRLMIFSVNTERQVVTWKHGKHAPGITTVPEHLQAFLRKLTNKVHDIRIKRAKALELKRKREEEAKEEAKKYYEANKEKIDAARELKRRKMNEKVKMGRESVDKARHNQELSCRKDELDHTVRVLNWKASATEQPTSSRVDKPTRANKMLESAKRGPKHDLCEDCAEKLRFCMHEECSIIGCIQCFIDNLTKCIYCTRVVCDQHTSDFNECGTCESLVCKPCGGQVCRLCKEFICYDCSECRRCDIRIDEDSESEEYDECDP